MCKEVEQSFFFLQETIIRGKCFTVFSRNFDFCVFPNFCFVYFLLDLSSQPSSASQFSIFTAGWAGETVKLI